MAIDQYSIQQIIASTSIRQYLKQKGCQPKKVTQQYSCYCCPLPNHNDKTPSFMVYHRKDESENFYCFGCHAFGNIIDLDSNVNQTSWGQSYGNLIQSGGIDVTNDGKLSYSIKKIKNDNKVRMQNGRVDSIGQISWMISNMGRSHMQLTNFDKVQIAFLQKLYMTVDSFVSSNDRDGLQKLLNSILIDNCLQTNLFQVRFKQWENKSGK